MKVSRMCLSLDRYTGAGPLAGTRALERRPPRTGLEQAAEECRAGRVNGFRFLPTWGRHTEKQGLLYVDSRLAVIPAKAGIHPFGVQLAGPRLERAAGASGILQFIPVSAGMTARQY